MKVIQIIHAPTGKILVTKRMAENKVIGVMAKDQQMGVYPEPHEIAYPGQMSVIETVERTIRVKGERQYQ